MIEFWDNAEEHYSFTNTVFSLLNHEYVSPAFPPRPVSWLYRLAERLFKPLGGLVYQTPPVPPHPPLAQDAPSPHGSHASWGAQHPGSPPRESSPRHDAAPPPPGGSAG
jgi:hypothetical protein